MSEVYLKIRRILVLSFYLKQVVFFLPSEEEYAGVDFPATPLGILPKA